MSDMFDRPRRVHPEGSYIGRLLAAADAALSEPQPDCDLPPFPFLPRTIPTDGNVQRNSASVTVQAEDFCA